MTLSTVTGPSAGGGPVSTVFQSVYKTQNSAGSHPAARAGQILATSAIRDALPEWPAIPQDPLMLTGFDDPVTAYDLHVPR